MFSIYNDYTDSHSIEIGGIHLRKEEIFLLLKNNLLLAMSITLIAVVILFIMYRFIYIKKAPQNRRLKPRQLIIPLLFVIYVFSVIALTLFRHYTGYEKIINLALFSSYQEAWYQFSTRAWQYIYFNIALFIPFGIFLPLLHQRFRKVVWTLLASFIFTGLIEVGQYITGVGIFELDDLFNNLLGALIGFGFVKIFLVRKLSLRILALLPLLLVIILSFGMFTYYEQKEFGNLAIHPTTKVNMKEVHVTTKLVFNEKQPTATVYKAPSLTKENAKKYAYTFFKDLNISTSSIEIISYQNEAVYRSNTEPSYSIWMHFLDSSYEWTDYSSFDEKRMNTTEANLKSALQKMKISLPENAVFKHLNTGQYKWSMQPTVTNDQLISGELKVTYYADKTIKEIENHLISYTKEKEVTLKSEKQAYAELLEGKFKLFDPNISNIQIEQIQQNYELDSKGFYQPVYSFTGKIDGEKSEILIAGLE